MSWLQRLIETYDACCGAEQFAHNPLPPISHTPQQAHIEIVLGGRGQFRRAELVQKDETLVPATERSAGRTGTKPPPHPLCDKIQYVAADYPAHGGARPSFHREYLEELEAWCASPFAHPKARAVLDYVWRGTVVHDLITEEVLHIDGGGKLLTRWDGTGERPQIFRLIAATDGEQDQGGAFVRWRVEIPGELESAVWRDKTLQDAWIAYNASQMTGIGLCMATGEYVPLTNGHPKRLRHPGDGAKLISSNDSNGYTFRGRFTDDTGDQACGIGFIASQKAHLALRWLIGKQAFRNGDQVVVSWAVRGDDVPDPLADTASLFGLTLGATEPGYRGDAGESYALALKKQIAGYHAILPDDSTVIVMALDSATPGRMAITFYREFDGAEFLRRIEKWHSSFAWRQNYGKDRRFTGAPSPRDIAQAAYGTNVDERLRKACVERLLPCIADGRPLPRDLVESAVRRAAQRAGMERWEWEKTLGIACSLYRGYHSERNYGMSLDLEWKSRDYLYGRLLAVADRIEGEALGMANENRDTTAQRLMHRFSQHPYSTWRTIELALLPYKSRLRSNDGSRGTLIWLDRKIDEICNQFEADHFISDDKLGGEFLLGFHCQRAKLFEPRPTDTERMESSEEEQPA